MQNSRTQLTILAACLLAGAEGAHAQAPTTFFTPGNLIIESLGGNGTAASTTQLTNSSTAVFIDEYATTLPSVSGGTGNLVQSIPLPTTPSATTAPYALTQAGNATSEGALTISNDGQYVAIGGYNTAVGTVSVAKTTVTAATYPTNTRVVGLINTTSGSVDTNTTTNTFYTGSNIRGVVAYDGPSATVPTVYTSGSGASPSTGGAIGYTSAEATANPTGVSTGSTNTRVVDVSGGNLYYTKSTGVYQVPGPGAGGSGLPTTAAASVSLVTTATTNFPASSTFDPYDFLFAGNNLYVASSNPSSLTLANLRGILKFTNTGPGTAYSYDYTIALDPSETEAITPTYLTGVTSADGLTETLYTTSYPLDSTFTYITDSRVLTATDTLAGTITPGTLTTLFTAGANTAFKGIRIAPSPAIAAPEPNSLVVFLIGFGVLGGIVARRRRMLSPVAFTPEQ